MRAMVMEKARQSLRLHEVRVPEPGPGQVMIRVRACGVCRTDLHIVDGELVDPKLPLILGHQAVGVVERVGEGVEQRAVGDRVGVPWLGWTCGDCRYCLSSLENLCDRALFTGYTVDGGFAEYLVVDSRYCFPVPHGYPDPEAAPLLCAGVIGFRSYRMVRDAERLGIYGVGAAAHILIQIAAHESKRVFAFIRPGDDEGGRFAQELGAVWAGGSDDRPPEELDAAIIFAPAGELVPAALRAVGKGGIVVCGGIHMSDIPSFPYEILWSERVLRSVANLTREDALELLRVAPQVPVRTHVETFPLERANEALESLRAGAVRGQNVLVIE